MTNSRIKLVVNGKQLETDKGRSILEALMDSGAEVIDSVGCLGQGVCGSCRVLIRHQDNTNVTSALACETKVEEGLQVSFLDHIPMSRQHVYTPKDWESKTWQILECINQTFPEAKHCRHCGGCDSACPKHLDVQKGVNMAAMGDLSAAYIFDECIMCNLCTIACPEMISPNHLGNYIRRLTTSVGFRPSDLMQRLYQIENGDMTIDLDVELE